MSDHSASFQCKSTHIRSTSSCGSPPPELQGSAVGLKVTPVTLVSKAKDLLVKKSSWRRTARGWTHLGCVHERKAEKHPSCAQETCSYIYISVFTSSTERCGSNGFGAAL